MPALKRPSASESSNPRKKPATSVKDLVSDVAQLKETDDDAGAGESRDKQKAQKFHKMLSANTLPAHIVHMFQVESKKAKEGQRAFQTKLINSLFEKADDGSYKIMTDKHEFEQYRKVFHQSLAKDKTEAMPRTLMLASHFHGNEALMKKALDNGELISKHDPESKLEYLQFRRFSNIEVRGNEEGETVKGNKRMNREQTWQV